MIFGGYEKGRKVGWLFNSAESSFSQNKKSEILSKAIT